MQMISRFLCWWALSCLATLSNLAMAQDDPSAQSTESDQARQVNDWATATVGRLKLKNVTQNRPLEIKQGSLLRWSNPIAGDVYGDSYLWMDQGRPAAFLSIYALYNTPAGNRRLTFQSLSTDKLSAQLDERIIWQPQSPAIEFVELDKSPTPQARISMQRIHMRRIAQEFSAKISETDDVERFRSLRLLTAPLLQYESLANDIPCGQLFAFVDGTDPELLLLIECHSNGDQRKWRYAAVRQNHRQLRLLRAENVIWEAPALAPPFPNPKISDPKGVYFNTKWSAIEPHDP